jgi:carotenoid cleavage dioxygenase-like enzyme
MHAVSYAWPQWMGHVQYAAIGTDGRVRRTVDIPVPGMTMLHDMSLTERYVVVYDQPVTVDIELAFASRFPFRWNPDYGCRLGLMPREGDADDIVWIDVPLSYTFHPLNAFDDAQGNVVIDQCVYDRMFAGDLNGPFGDNLARLERWVIDPVARTCAVTVIDDRPSEFPRVRGSVAGQSHRYGYAVRPGDEPEWPTVKYDLQTGEVTEFDHGPGRGAGEGVFVARPDAAAEDDGWLITLVHDVPNESAELLVLDAQEMREVARVLLPQRVPYGFHGNWVSDRSVPPPA